MDAAQKLLKTSAILLAIALLTAAPGWAQPTLLAPSTVTIGATGSAFTGVTSSAAGTTEITYTVATSYSADTSGSGSWLVVTPNGTTTPASLSFGLRNNSTAGLNLGATATVTLTPTSPAGVAAVTITVTFGGSGGGGGGGGSITLSASSNPVNLTAAANSQTSTPVTITTTSVSAITIQVGSSVASGGTNWLSTSITNTSLSSAAGASITIFANAFNLAAGFTYQGTVTVTPSTGTPLNITVNFTVGSGAGDGTWSASPGTIPWNFTTNSGIFPAQSVSVSTTSASTFYSIATTSSNGWLVAFFNGGDVTGITGITVGTPFTLKVGSQGNALTAGQYSGQAIITDSNSSEQLRVNVTLTVNGGNSAGLTVTPNPVPFSAALNSAQQSQVVTLNSNVGGSVTVTGIGTSPAWLSATGPSPATVVAGQASSFTVYANPSGLLSGSYSASIAVSVGSQSGTLIVNLVVGGGSGGTGTTAVAPTSLNFAYQFGTNVAFVARQKLVVTGPAGAWSSVISNGATWLRLSPGGGGALPNPAIDADTPTVTIDPTGLTVGPYAGTITITTAGGTQAVQVALNVLSAAVLLPTPGALTFNAQTGQANPGGQSLYFSDSDNSLNVNVVPISAVSNNAWISIVAGVSYVSVQVDQTGLGTGVYSGSISVSQTGAANSPTTIPILLVVNGGGSGGTFGTLTFSQSPISFTSSNGSTPGSTTLTVSAASATSFVGSIAYTNGSGWLSVSPLSGVTPVNLSVSANPAGLAAGPYNATISFTANGVIQNVGVTLTVSTSGGNTGNVTVSPTSLTFTAQQGASPGAQSISVSSPSGAAGVTFTTQVTAGSNWLSTSANASNTAPASLTVSVSSNLLQANSYTGNILITPTGGTAVNVPVTLTITPPSVVSAAPASLSFDYRAGDSAPAAQPLAVSGGGATLNYAATPSSNGNWLVVLPASGTTPATVNVSINTANLTAGIGAYNGTVLVAGAGGATGSTTVTVTLNVTAPLPTLTKVTNAASYATGSISPGEIVTLFASDPTHPIGPATAAGLALDPTTGKVSTTIGGVQVLVQGYLCPMIYASASQVSAVVPYEIKILTSATVLVKFLGQSSNGVLVNVATTVPGVFTANASGTGPGAIANSNGSTNAPANPATRGDIVVVFLTGEGETSPAGVTGKVTTVASPPQPLTPAPLLPVSVTIGGQPAQWSFAGEAPTFVSGVMQLNVVVPTNIAAGDQPIVVTIGVSPSQQGVTVSVK